MTKRVLNITNGSSLTTILEKEKYDGEIVTWHEMLCEGPTEEIIDTDTFYAKRKTYLELVYDVEYDESKIKSEIRKLDHINNYKEVILWFEYDLFCHINLIAIISLLKQKDIRVPISLVCSGRIDHEPDLKGLSQLTSKQLKEHYHKRVLLEVDDIALAQKAWNIYCGDNHNDLKPLIVRSSSFIYLTNCLKAHLKRFPDTRSGLSTLEYNTLKLIKEHKIKSRHHLLGYALHYQGYYGFGDIQIKRMIDELALFYIETDNSLTLNRKGHLAIEHIGNYRKELQSDYIFGGSNKNHFQFNKKENRLIRNTVYAN